MFVASKVKLYQLRSFILDRLGERGTWQGIGFFVGVFISKDWADLDWGMAAFIGSSLSGIIKIIFPDSPPANEINVTVVQEVKPEETKDA